MFDTHAIARSLTDAELTPAQADAITAAVRQAAEQGDHVTPDMLVVCPKNDFTLVSCGQRVAETPNFRGDCGMRRCRSAEVELQTCSSDTPLDARLAALEMRLVKWTVGTGIAVAGTVIAFLRLVG